MSDNPDIVATIIQRELDRIATATEIAAGMEIVKLRARISCLEAEIAEGIAWRKHEEKMLSEQRAADEEDTKWAVIHGR